MEIRKEDFKKYIAILGNREEYCMFSGRPEWDDTKKAYVIPGSSPRKKTEWVRKEQLERVIEENIRRGWTTWISLNEKEKGKDNIEGTSKIWCIWFDFDAKREDKSRVANEEEKKEALERGEKLKDIMESMGLKGFLACSGNGYHLFFPIQGYELRGNIFRKEFNEKLRMFYNKLKEKTGIEFDTTTDIRRVTQPIGYPNMKIPDCPIDTFWITEFDIHDIEEAKRKNEDLIETILNMDLREEKKTKVVEGTIEDEKFEELLKQSEKVRDLYKGLWKGYGYKSRSEAEAALVTILCLQGFSDESIKKIMSNSLIGKWNEKNESYYNLTIKKCREFIEGIDIDKKKEEVKEKKRKEKIKEEIRSEEIKIEKENAKAKIIEELMNNYIFVTTEDNEEIYVYSNGIYKEGETLIKSEIENVLKEETSTYIVNEILNHIRRRTYVPRSLFNMDKNFLPVKNGLLHLTELKLYPFDSSKIFTYQLPMEYDPTKDCPRIKKFISEVIKSEDLTTVQEFLGYCLYPDMPAHKTLWLYGTGRNGKTTFVNLVRRLIGDACIASVTLDELDGYHRFSIARLYGKLLNIVSEPSTMRAMHTVEFKKLTGGDFISAEIKNKQKTIDFVNFAKFIIYGNKFPVVRDPSPAFWSRLIVIHFPNKFEDNAIPNYDKMLIESDGDLSGFLNWCLEGLKRLMTNNFHFTTSKTSEELKTEFIKQSDSVRAFIRTKCTYDSSAYITKETLYEAYKIFCEEEGLTIRGKKTFSEIVGESPRIYSKIKLIDGKAHRCWFGLRLKSEEKEEEEKESEYIKENKEIFKCICGIEFSNIYDLEGHQLMCKKLEKLKKDGYKEEWLQKKGESFEEWKKRLSMDEEFQRWQSKVTAK